MSSQSNQSTQKAAGTAGNESTPTTAGAAGTAGNELTPTTAGAAGTAPSESPSGKVNATDHEPHVGQKRKEFASSNKASETSSPKVTKPKNKRKIKQKTPIDPEKIAKAEAQLAALRSGTYEDPMEINESDDDPEQEETQKDNPNTSMDESKLKSLRKPHEDGDSSSMSQKKPQNPVLPSVPSEISFFDKKTNLVYAEGNDLDADDLEITPEGSAIIRDVEGNLITPTYLVQFAGRGGGNSRKAVAKYGDGRRAIYRVENVTGRVLNVPDITDPQTRPGEACHYNEGVKVYKYNKCHCKGMIGVAIETDLDGEDAVRTLDPSLYGYDEGKMKKISFPSSRQGLVWEIESRLVISWETRTVVQRVWSSKKEVCHRDVYRRAIMDYQQFLGGEHVDLGTLKRPDTKSPSPELSRRRRPSIVAQSPGFLKGPKATPKVKQEPQSPAGIAKTTAPPQGEPSLEKVVQTYCQMFQKEKDSLTLEERFACMKLFKEEGGQF